jgi:hypothetical protein
VPRREFERIDVRLWIRRQASSGYIVVAARPDAPPASRPLSDVEMSRITRARAPLEKLLARVLPGRPALSRRAVVTTPAGVAPIDRITLEIGDVELASVPWERDTGLAGRRGRHPWPAVVRVSPVLPEFRSVPLTYPLRFLQVGTAPGFSLVHTIEEIFGRHRSRWMAAARAGRTTFSGATRWLRAHRWPTAEVLHLSALPRAPLPRLLSWARPEDLRTLGGLARLCHAWQTRLLVFACARGAEVPPALRLAHRLVSRGGPAVLVTHAWTPGEFWHFYGRLVHDNPLDWILDDMPGARSRCALFAGSGREDGLRVSTPAMVLSREGSEEAAGQTAFTLDDAVAPEWPELRRIAMRQGHRLDAGARQQAGEALDALRAGMEGQYLFVDHESEGLIPCASHVRDIRRVLGVTAPVSQADALAAAAGERVVNPILFQGSGARGLRRIDGASQWLRRGDTYHLALQIGLRDTTLQVVGQAAIIEEVFKWPRDSKGTWVQFGVTGIGFDVIGDPVREAWLPRAGPTDPVIFPVVPRHAGACSLRICLYHGNNVVQAIKLVALTDADGSWRTPAHGDVVALARELGITDAATPVATYISRLEYNQVPADAPERCHYRPLSIVANDANGQTVLSIKTDEELDVQIDPNLKDYVRDARDRMLASASPCEPSNQPDRWLYRFLALTGEPNVGTADLYRATMRSLAATGRDLWGKVFQGAAREHVDRALAVPSTIHVAHTLLDATIPWALMYGRDFDDGRDGEAGVVYEACTAPFRGKPGEFRDVVCEVDEHCPLNPRRLTERKRGEGRPYRNTVACPQSFWGFRHVIEMPPCQTTDGTSQSLPQPPEVIASNPPQVLVGYHTGLRTAATHVADLQRALVGPPSLGTAGTPITARQTLLDALKSDALDLIYLFCHTRGGLYAVQRVNPPELRLADGFIKPIHLDHRPPWSHRPFVVLNGCNTGGFSCDALSEFVKELTARGASGVLATEIPVFEQLAGEFGKIFVKEFLGGRTAGQALLEARRHLLAKQNPLGLIYTLYAPADLILRRSGGPAPSRGRPTVRLRRARL